MTVPPLQELARRHNVYHTVRMTRALADQLCEFTDELQQRLPKEMGYNDAIHGGVLQVHFLGEARHPTQASVVLIGLIVQMKQGGTQQSLPFGSFPRQDARRDKNGFVLLDRLAVGLASDEGAQDVAHRFDEQL